MTYLTLNFEPDVTEITLKTHMGKVHKINVPEVMMNSKKIKIISGNLQTNATITEFRQDVELLPDMPDINSVRQRIRELDETSEVILNSFENIKRDSEGLPNVEQLRKLL